MVTHTPPSYLPEIDGLRAIAVLSVLLFHADFSFSGGYVGVDVFFVISGFLITSLIWKDLERGSFSFAHFWERRARRIVPAMAVVTVAALAAGWFVLVPADLKSLGRAAASQAVFAVNVHYWFDSGYFAGGTEEKPLLHTWSLAVEEQFYLVAPFGLWAMYRFAGVRTRAGMSVLLATAIGISLATSIYVMNRAPSAVFYLLPGRAWELLLGSLVAVVPAAGLLSQRGARDVLSFAGLALILGPVFMYTSETAFPGAAAVPPCLGAALLIWSNRRADGSPPTVIGRLLSVRPLVFIGLISYSLYLWHWPLLAFRRYLAFAPLPAGDRIALLGLSFLLAVLSWKYVELPFRNRSLAASRAAMFGYAGAGLAVTMTLGLLCWRLQGFPERLPAIALEFANAKFDTAFQAELTVDDIRAGRLVEIGVVDPGQRPAVLVWGDSHAMAALPAVDALLKERGLVGLAATHTSTAPVLDWFTQTRFGLDEKAVEFNDAVFSYIQQRRIPIVILSAFWSSYGPRSGTFGSALLATVENLVANGSRPFILLDVPGHPFDVPRAISRSILSQTSLNLLSARPQAKDQHDGIQPEVVAAIETAGGRFLDPKPRFLDPTGQFYLIDFKGVALYSDNQHVTTKGAKLMLLPLLRESLPLVPNH